MSLRLSSDNFTQAGCIPAPRSFWPEVHRRRILTLISQDVELLPEREYKLEVIDQQLADLLW